MTAFEHEKRKFFKERRFPASIFFVFFGTLLLMSGIHFGIIVLGSHESWNMVVQVILPTLYWGAVALGLTLFTRMKIRRHYEEPVHKLQEAMEKVADGDFSIYVSPLHAPDELDYLDAMILDFDKMVEELGSIEVLKTDFISSVSHEIKPRSRSFTKTPNSCKTTVSLPNKGLNIPRRFLKLQGGFQVSS